MTTLDTPAAKAPRNSALSFAIRPISMDFAQRVRSTLRDDFGRPVEVTVAEGGEPMRDQLRRAKPGERLILCSFPMNPATEDTSLIRDKRVKARSGRRFAAVVLFAIGFIALSRDYWDISWREWMVALIGLGFVVWSGMVRESALLVPGGIMIGIGVGQLLRPGWGNGAFALAMAGGFLLIIALSRLIFGRQKGESWPLYPAAGLALVGLLQMAGSGLREWFRLARPFWPYALIIVALFLWFKQPAEKK